MNVHICPSWGLAISINKHENFDLLFLKILSGFLFVVHGLVKARQDRSGNVILMAENRI